MAATSTMTTSSSPEIKMEPNSTSGLGEMQILDDLLQLRAADKDQIPLLAFPKSERGVTDYEQFTGKDLDRFVDQTAKHYMRCGLKPNECTTVAILGPSDLNYLVSFFALSRLGYTVLLLSPRLATPAYVALLEATSGDTVIHIDSPQARSKVSQIRQQRSISSFPMARREDFDVPTAKEPPFVREVDRTTENSKIAVICHSSGSTGLPKPIYQPHKRVLAKLPRGAGTQDLCAFPWYHSWGHKVCIHAMYSRKTMYMFNANLPMTADNLTAVVDHVRPGVFHAVPYVLKLLGQTEPGIGAMKACNTVVYSGTQCSDELGDALVNQGVNLASLFGATEIGLVGTSMNRPHGDNAWNYIRIAPSLRQFLQIKPIDETNSVFEFVFLHGSPNLVVSNSENPPNSFHSRDLFTPHPTIQHAWKYLGRLDDRVTLSNGEKVLPLPIEGRVRQDALVREAVVFGVGRSIPGLLVFRAEAAKNMSDTDYIDAIWPAIRDANSRAEAFSQISKDTVIPLPAGIEYPSTDKRTIIRAQVYSTFAEQIELMYHQLDSATGGTLILDIPGLQQYLLANLYASSNDRVGIAMPTIETDFFAAGVDSLHAIELRGLIQRDLNLAGAKLSQNVVFECGNVVGLARHLYALRVGDDLHQGHEDDIETMAAMINKYSVFDKHVPGTVPSPSGHVVVLTGVTGSLGAHVLAQLLDHEGVHKVYCLLRGETPLDRVLTALQERSLEVSDVSKIVALTSDFSKADLGLGASLFDQLRNSVSYIIHSAWAVNYNLGLRSFEEQHIKGLHNLIQLSLSVRGPAPAQLFFCSSVSAAMATPPTTVVEEAPIENLAYAMPQGYARSKLVSEHILHNAAHAGACCRVLRIGQIVGDAKVGLWNDTEAIPLMIRSALTLKALPALDMDTCSWLPADTVAATILDLAGVFSVPAASAAQRETNPFLVYNIVNPKTFSWTADLLPALRIAGLAFSTVPLDKWLGELRSSAARGDVERNPAVKLVEHFERSYGDQREKARPVFSTRRAEEDSAHLRDAPDLVQGGYIEKFVQAWLRRWG